MNDGSFSQALRAELDAVIARYEALVRARQEWLASSHSQKSQSLRDDLRVAEQERDRLRAEIATLEQKVAKLEGKLEQRSAEITTLREKVEAERERTLEASSRAAESLAEARLQIGELTAKLDLVAEESRVFEATFAAEVSFVEACLELSNTALLDAIEHTSGATMALEPAVYGALKAERLDVVLTRAVRHRGRSVVDKPLERDERKGLEALADAAGCELIVPELGARFSNDEMEKVATAPDPAEEGNVLACLMPGLRLAGSEGALVFPKVKVAVG